MNENGAARIASDVSLIQNNVEKRLSFLREQKNKNNDIESSEKMTALPG